MKRKWIQLIVLVLILSGCSPHGLYYKEFGEYQVVVNNHFQGDSVYVQQDTMKVVIGNTNIEILRFKWFGNLKLMNSSGNENGQILPTERLDEYLVKSRWKRRGSKIIVYKNRNVLLQLNKGSTNDSLWTIGRGNVFVKHDNLK